MLLYRLIIFENARNTHSDRQITKSQQINAIKIINKVHSSTFAIWPSF